MHGDFTRWKLDEPLNWNGILHQQGRVLLDVDVTDQTRYVSRWQDAAARAAFGQHVAAVSESQPDGFQVTGAQIVAGEVRLDIQPGQVWADGMLAHLRPDPAEASASAPRVAAHMGEPVQTAPADVGADGTRDAVILEVWREALNGFQVPDRLIEPALGGPDTAERLMTAFAFRLVRLDPGETCSDVVDRIQDDLSRHGRLTVTLQPTTTTDDDCPTVEGGGYTGLEHHLFRIEIAQTHNGGGPMFKWSRFNGGLVGRGSFSSSPDQVTITANRQAILRAGLEGEFYLEALEPRPHRGDAALSAELAERWEVVYGARATLNAEGGIDLGTTLFGEIPTDDPPRFFRLWDGIRPVGDFPIPAAEDEPTELVDGIRLAFEADADSTYRPGDYWTFGVRAGDVVNDEVLINGEPPEGVRRHRVSLAILKWGTSSTGALTWEAGQIDDCRQIILPLSKRPFCCTFRVGDGRHSHGDFNSLEEAVRHLPESGGEICLLPGHHRANVRLQNKKHIRIHGCDSHTLVVPREENRPIFHLADCEDVTLEHMDLASVRGTPIRLEGSQDGALCEIAVAHNRIQAYDNAIVATRGVGIHILGNKIRMLDTGETGVAILLLADDSLVERNDIGVVPTAQVPPPIGEGGGKLPDPSDPCAEPRRFYADPARYYAYLRQFWSVVVAYLPGNPFKALGGIQILGGSDRVRVLENVICGGAGNGITLGGALASSGPREDTTVQPAFSIEHKQRLICGWVENDLADPSGITLAFQGADAPIAVNTREGGYFSVEAPPGTYSVSVLTPGYRIEDIPRPEDTVEFGRFYHIKLAKEQIDYGDLLAFLTDIQIDGNRISQMGRSGIGLPPLQLPERRSVAVTVLAQQFAVVQYILALFGNPIVGLDIRENHIFRCFQNRLMDDRLRRELALRGNGGISLGAASTVTISGNRIEDNGTSHVTPACGVFLLFGEQVNIHHNLITRNGPLTLGANLELQSGQRGGIVVGLATSVSLLDPLHDPEGSPLAGRLLNGRNAARIHENVVQQPAGPALRTSVLGPVSVLNNRLASELTGSHPLDRLAGAVTIINLGGISRYRPLQAMHLAARDNEAGASSRFTLVQLQPAVALSLPDGNVLFNGNQTRVGSLNTSITSQLIATFDDLGFDGNQCDALGPGFPIGDWSLLANTLLWCVTVRATDNRFKERFDLSRGVIFSLLSASYLMNNTTNNQADHCIIAGNAYSASANYLVNTPNQMLLPCGWLAQVFTPAMLLRTSPFGDSQ